MSQAQVDAYSAVMKAMYAQGLTQVIPCSPLQTCLPAGDLDLTRFPSLCLLLTGLQGIHKQTCCFTSSASSGAAPEAQRCLLQRFCAATLSLLLLQEQDKLLTELRSTLGITDAQNHVRAVSALYHSACLSARCSSNFPPCNCSAVRVASA